MGVDVREIHGVRAKKLTAVGATDQQEVTVEDGVGVVILGLGSHAFPAALTPEEAREIADRLRDAADRVVYLEREP